MRGIRSETPYRPGCLRQYLNADDWPTTPEPLRTGGEYIGLLADEMHTNTH